MNKSQESDFGDLEDEKTPGPQQERPLSFHQVQKRASPLPILQGLAALNTLNFKAMKAFKILQEVSSSSNEAATEGQSLLANDL
jgi:hypothetical protein